MALFLARVLAAGEWLSTLFVACREWIRAVLSELEAPQHGLSASAALRAARLSFALVARTFVPARQLALVPAALQGLAAGSPAGKRSRLSFWISGCSGGFVFLSPVRGEFPHLDVFFHHCARAAESLLSFLPTKARLFLSLRTFVGVVAT